LALGDFLIEVSDVAYHHHVETGDDLLVLTDFLSDVLSVIYDPHVNYEGYKLKKTSSKKYR
jgi:hypothetical protein